MKDRIKTVINNLTEKSVWIGMKLAMEKVIHVVLGIEMF